MLPLFFILLIFLAVPLGFFLADQKLKATWARRGTILLLYLAALAAVWAIKSLETKKAVYDHSLAVGTTLEEIETALQEGDVTAVLSSFKSIRGLNSWHAPTYEEIEALGDSVRKAN